MKANINGMPEMPRWMNEMFNMFFNSENGNFGRPNVQIFRNGASVNLNRPGSYNKKNIYNIRTIV